MVLCMDKALPNPVSMSTNNGTSGTRDVIRLISIHTSFRFVIPRSGRPYDAVATPDPERYID